MKIDLVYLWVDDTDWEWKRRRNKYIDTFDEYDEDATDECRFYNNDELKYSLRSVEKNAPWVNKIFIVTDNQIPEWLDTENEKIKIVNHCDIIPEQYLPIFNSNAIESRIPFISGLSEYFLYANDDTFFWNPVEKDFFFKDNKPIFRRGKYLKKSKVCKRLYGTTIQYSYNTLSKNIQFRFLHFSRIII